MLAQRDRHADLRDMLSSFRFCSTKESNWRVDSKKRTKINSCDTAAAEGVAAVAGVELGNASCSSSNLIDTIQVDLRIHYLICHSLGNHLHFCWLVLVGTDSNSVAHFKHHQIIAVSRLNPH